MVPQVKPVGKSQLMIQGSNLSMQMIYLIPEGLAKMDMVKNCIPVVGGRLFQST
jgi:hypothetical protein